MPLKCFSKPHCEIAERWNCDGSHGYHSPKTKRSVDLIIDSPTTPVTPVTPVDRWRRWSRRRRWRRSINERYPSRDGVRAMASEGEQNEEGWKVLSEVHLEAKNSEEYQVSEFLVLVKSDLCYFAHSEAVKWSQFALVGERMALKEWTLFWTKMETLLFQGRVNHMLVFILLVIAFCFFVFFLASLVRMEWPMYMFSFINFF